VSLKKYNSNSILLIFILIIALLDHHPPYRICTIQLFLTTSIPQPAQPPPQPMSQPQPQLQPEAPPAPPGGRWPPRVAIAELPERRNCKQHPSRKLSDEEIFYGYTHCSLCRERESDLAAAMRPTIWSRTRDNGDRKGNQSLLGTMIDRVRSRFAC
jgi:hypothetical protein